jgi:cystathionine beta-lyase/cystathionine gamma-synthase
MKPVSNHLVTRSVQIGEGHDDHTGGISFPIYPSATYRHPGVGRITGYDYTRTGNPTREVLERLQLISFAESLGGVETLITLPAIQTHGDIPGSIAYG